MINFEKLKAIFILVAILLMTVTVIALCAGCEQLKEHKDDIHNYLIELMQGKGEEK